MSIFIFFCSDTLYVLISFSIEELFWHLIKFCENFSLGSSLNQSRTYQGNPCDFYPDLFSLSGSGVNPNSVTCIKRSAPSKNYIKMIPRRKRFLKGLLQVTRIRRRISRIRNQSLKIRRRNVSSVTKKGTSRKTAQASQGSMSGTSTMQMWLWLKKDCCIRRGFSKGMDLGFRVLIPHVSQ